MSLPVYYKINVGSYEMIDGNGKVTKQKCIFFLIDVKRSLIILPLQACWYLEKCTMQSHFKL